MRDSSVQEPSEQGVALIAELVAALTLVAMLIGFRVSRSQLWLFGSIIAFIVFMAAATLVVSSTA
jgi:hypothetical protein